MLQRKHNKHNSTQSHITEHKITCHCTMYWIACTCICGNNIFKGMAIALDNYMYIAFCENERTDCMVQRFLRMTKIISQNVGPNYFGAKQYHNFQHSMPWLSSYWIEFLNISRCSCWMLIAQWNLEKQSYQPDYMLRIILILNSCAQTSPSCIEYMYACQALLYEQEFFYPMPSPFHKETPQTLFWINATISISLKSWQCH